MAKRVSLKESHNLPSGPVSTISSPTFEPKSSSLSLVSTPSSFDHSGANGNVPAPPPPPPTKPNNRRDSTLSTTSSIQDERSPLQQAQLIFNGRKDSSISTDIMNSINGDTSFVSSEVEQDESDTSSMILDDCSVSNSNMSISAADYLEPDNSEIPDPTSPIHGSNESLLRQISSIEKIAAKHNKNDSYSNNFYNKNTLREENVLVDEEIEEKKNIQKEKELFLLMQEEELKRKQNELKEQQERLQEEQENLLRQKEAQKREEEERMKAIESQLMQDELRKEDEERVKHKEEQDRLAKLKEEEELFRIKEEERLARIKKEEEDMQAKIREEDEKRIRLQKEEDERLKNLKREQEMQAKLREAEIKQAELKRIEEERQAQLKAEQERQQRLRKEEEERVARMREEERLAQLREEEVKQAKMKREQEEVLKKLREEEEILAKLKAEEELKARQLIEEQERLAAIKREREMQERLKKEEEQKLLALKRFKEEQEERERLFRQAQEKEKEEQERLRLFREQQRIKEAEENERKLAFERQEKLRKQEERTTSLCNNETPQVKTTIGGQRFPHNNVNRFQVLQERRFQQQAIAQNAQNTFHRFSRQGSVPSQSPCEAAGTTSDAEETRPEQHVRSSSVNRSPNISPTSGLSKAPLPWMSGIARRETSAPPEFVNYAQNAQARLQQQRSRWQQHSAGSSMQSPTFRETVPVSPPVGHPSHATLPRRPKSASTAAHRPWVAKHLQYQAPQREFLPQPSTQKWPSVKTNYLNQESAPSKPLMQRRSLERTDIPYTRIIPVNIEQPSPSNSHSPIVHQPNSFSRINSTNSSPANVSNVSQFSPPTPVHATSPFQKSIQPQDANFGSFKPSHALPPRPITSPVSYSKDNPVEALQQMQQNLEKLNCGLQNSYPIFITDQMSLNQGEGSADSPTHEAPPLQSRSFRILQHVVAAEPAAHSAPVSRIASAPAHTRPQGGVGVWSPRAMPAPHNGQYGVSDM